MKTDENGDDFQFLVGETLSDDPYHTEFVSWHVDHFSFFLGRVRPPYMAISGRPADRPRQKLDC